MKLHIGADQRGIVHTVRATAASVAVAYLDEGDGPPVLLIYGIPTSSFLWRDIVPALAENA
jgi:pimeloyl-ACP methyl ester carboxylesterase